MGSCSNAQMVYHSFRLERSVEDPPGYMVAIGWET